MKKWILWILILACGMNVHAKEEPEQLYAQSAVLMDADTGRVLFEKNGNEQKAMASTTKIMTCILALENLEDEAIVAFSKQAQQQPKVHLGAMIGEQFCIKDLLYSLMLESHNDSAVAIAEGIAGSVEAFVEKMNQKAKEIGCKDTYFITPNGLDASDEKGTHSTTAVDLAKIMSYCIKESSQHEQFLKITSTAEYHFQNMQGNKSYTCNNHNSFLNMMEEAISGKTGFTSKAGYCYVGAAESEGRTFVVSLLGCGWPNNKNYKWADMKTLVSYGMGNYHFETLDAELDLDNIEVFDGVGKTNKLFDGVWIKPYVLDKKEKVLLKNDESVDIEINMEKELFAPIKKGEKIGEVIYRLNGEVITRYSIQCTETIEKRTTKWVFRGLVKIYLL